VRRALLLAAAALPLALALTACPIPQPLAEVARSTDGGTVSTPIILTDTAVPPDTVVPVRTDCSPAAQFTLSATVEDLDTSESVEARWFMDYGTGHGLLLEDEESVPASEDPSDPRRLVTPVQFTPYAYGVPPAIGLHVVELVVSNGFLALSDPTPPLQRAAAPPFVTQAYRWVFQYVDPSDPRGRCQ